MFSMKRRVSYLRSYRTFGLDSTGRLVVLSFVFFLIFFFSVDIQVFARPCRYQGLIEIQMGLGAIGSGRGFGSRIS